MSADRHTTFSLISEFRGSLVASRGANRVAWTFVGALVAFIAIWNIRSAGFMDFGVYRLAGQRAWAHASIYDPNVYLQYKYSPFTAWVFGALGLMHARATWFFYEINLLAWLLWAAIFLVRLPKASRGICALALFCILGNALRFDLELGQINVWPWLLLWWAMRVWASEKPASFWAELGAVSALSMAIQLKLYALIALPWMIFRGLSNGSLGRMAARVVAVFIHIVVCNTLFLGIVAGGDFTFAGGEFLKWGSTLTASSRDMLFAEYNVSLLGFVGKRTGLHFFAVGVWIAAAFGFLAWQWRARRLPVFEIYAGLLVGILVLNPLVWTYWVLALVPALVALIERCRWRGLLLGGIFLFAAFNPQHAWIARQWLIPLAIVGVAGLFYLNVIEKRLGL